MDAISAWSYHWNERGGSSYNQYLRSRDIVRSINGGTYMAAAGLASCMAVSTQQILGSVQSLQDSIASQSDRLARIFTWGFSETLANLGGMQTTLQELLKTSKTPSQTAAYEHFDIAREAFRKGLYPECLEALGQAIHGVPGVSAGYRLEWRFHQLRGLVLLGSHNNPDGELLNPIEAEICFLTAARYAKADAPTDAATAFLSAGWAAYVQVDRADSAKLHQALEYTQKALELEPDLGEALFQLAKFQMSLGRPADGLSALRRAAEREPLFLAKAAADGDFQRHGDELNRFLENLRQEIIQQLQRELEPIALAIHALHDDAPTLKSHASAARVIDYALNPGSKSIVELIDYKNLKYNKDRETLELLDFIVKRITVKEWEETVLEKIATGEVEQLVETVQETYWEEEARSAGWFRREKRIMVEKTRPKRVVREIPQTKEVQQKVSRRSETSEWVICNGLGGVVTVDYKRYLEAAEQGDAIAQYKLGLIYFTGEAGVPKDHSQAAKWYRKSAEQGNTVAMTLLGMFGDAEAFRWSRIAAEQEHPPAQCRLGNCYFYGHGVPKERTEAVKWYRKAAEQGHATAQCLLGHIFFTGDGALKDSFEAAKWFLKAAEQEKYSAYCQLGHIFFNGDGALKDSFEAARWYLKAAERPNNAIAQYKLGFMYRNGEGVPKDVAQAHAWYYTSTSASNIRIDHPSFDLANKAMEDSKKNLGIIEKTMTPDQKAEAIKIAREIFEKIESNRKLSKKNYFLDVLRDCTQ
jgi:hypothetical protein